MEIPTRQLLIQVTRGTFTGVKFHCCSLLLIHGKGTCKYQHPFDHNEVAFRTQKCLVKETSVAKKKNHHRVIHKCRKNTIRELKSHTYTRLHFKRRKLHSALISATLGAFLVGKSTQCGICSFLRHAYHPLPPKLPLMERFLGWSKIYSLVFSICFHEISFLV